MLRTPIAEVAERTAEFNPDAVEKSLDRLFQSLLEPPLNKTEGEANTRTSIAVIKSFWKNFCRIPPFCASRGE